MARRRIGAGHGQGRDRIIKFNARARVDLVGDTGKQAGAALRFEVDQPIAFALAQNYPNPFNPSTVIQYALPQTTSVTLKVYDLLGKEVATLVDGIQDAGSYTRSFDASELPAGVYLYRLQAGPFTATQLMTLLI